MKRESVGRVIATSVTTHFKNALTGKYGASKYWLRIMGAPAPEEDATGYHKSRHFEIRVDGPHMFTLGGNLWELNSKFSVLIITDSKTAKDAFALQDMTSYVQSKFPKSLQIRDYSTAESGGTLVGCMKLVANRSGNSRNKLGAFQYDKVDPTLDQYQASVVASYKFELELED
jgi:hypothetical protein